jgi:RNA ligase (TIGR02306 family)
MTRKLVTIREIEALTPIEGADRIVCAQIGGWKLVVKKGEFQVGDKAVYFEIDSFLPASDSRYSFLKDERVMEGRAGYRLKTVKMKGQVSQGLALPLSLFPEVAVSGEEDLASQLGVMKWEAPESSSVSLSGQMKGLFPAFIPKTDQERCQNMKSAIFAKKDEDFVITEKLDGSSFTAFFNEGESGVCSRNYELKVDTAESIFVRMFTDKSTGESIQERLTRWGKNIAIQGELVGPGIQGNKYKLNEHRIYVFDVYDIDAKRYLSPGEMEGLVGEVFGLQVVPVVFRGKLGEVSSLPDSTGFLGELMLWSEGPSVLRSSQTREGVVCKTAEGERFSFKVISSKFLLEEK